MKLFIFLLFIICSNSFCTEEYLPIDRVKCLESDNLVTTFLNGVDNIPKDAFDSIDAIRFLNEKSNLVFNKRGKLNICYKYVYNQTDSLFDWVESLAQKIREANQDLSEEEVYRLVSKLIIAPTSLAISAVNPTPIPSDAIAEILAESTAKRVQDAELETIETYTTPIIMGDLEDKSVLLVSHSQGNLFANLIYKRLIKDTDLEGRMQKFANLQVATPAGVLEAKTKSFGDYVTLKQDKVISPIGLAFELLTPNVESESISIEPVAKFYPIYNSDLVGHSFINVYLNEDIKGTLDGEVESKEHSRIFLEKLDNLGQKITSNIPSSLDVKFKAFDFDDSLLRDSVAMEQSEKEIRIELSNIEGLRIDSEGNADEDIMLRYRFDSSGIDDYTLYEEFNLSDLSVNASGNREIIIKSVNFSDSISFYTYEGVYLGRVIYYIPFLRDIGSSISADAIDLRLLNPTGNDLNKYKVRYLQYVNVSGTDATSAGGMIFENKVIRDETRVRLYESLNNLIGRCYVFQTSLQYYEFYGNQFDLDSSISFESEFQISFENNDGEVFKVIDFEMAPGTNCYNNGNLLPAFQLD